MSRARGEARRRTKVCPECGKAFSPQGLNGHLRFKHGLEGQAVTQQTEAATVTVADGLAERTDITVGLIDRLKGVRREMENLPQRGFFADEDGCDEAMDDCLAALQLRELEIRNEVRKLSGRPALRRTTEPVLGGLLGEREVLVDDVEEV